MAEHCIGIRFKQDISLVVYNVTANPNRLPKLLRREKRRGKLQF